METKRLLAMGWLIGFCTAGSQAAVRYAATASSGSGDCSSWANVCTLASARSAASSGDEIWVKAGTYGPLALKNGVKIIGGFAGTESAASQSNPATNATIIDGNDQDQCVTGSGEGPTTMLRGFTIKNCVIEGSDPIGAGIYLSSSSAMIVQCIIEENEAVFFGAGAAIEGTGTPEFINCIFRSNGTGSGTSALPYGGGAVHIASGSPKFTNCLFHDNVAGEGGAVFNRKGNPTFINCTFSQNAAGLGSGGGIFDHAGTATIHNSVIWGNDDVRTAPDLFNRIGVTSTMTYGDIEGGYTGTGNINSDPLFVSAGSNDFKLGGCSPCRNVGSNSLLPADVADLDWDGNTTDHSEGPGRGQPQSRRRYSRPCRHGRLRRHRRLHRIASSQRVTWTSPRAPVATVVGVGYLPACARKTGA